MKISLSPRNLLIWISTAEIISAGFLPAKKLNRKGAKMSTEELRKSPQPSDSEETVPEPAVKMPVIPRQKADPLSVGDYIVIFILFSLPVVNLVLAIVWSFTEGVNPNRKNFARAYLLLWAIFLVIFIITGILVSLVFGQFIPLIQEFFQGF